MSCELDPRLRKRAENLLQTTSRVTGKEYWQSRTKRQLDLLIAAPATTIALPAIVLAGMAVLASDKRWPPYIKLNIEHPLPEKSTTIYKVRTMIPGAHMEELHVIGKNQTMSAFKRSRKDPRIIRGIGSALRKCSIDELPQFLNVLRGNCSMVGPRPFSLPDWENHIYPNQDHDPFKGFIDLLKEGLPYGVTGFYGIFGRANLELIDRLSLDVLYGKHASFKSDLRIIALTVPAVLNRKGAY